jgi:hypothetical protein
VFALLVSRTGFWGIVYPVDDSHLDIPRTSRVIRTAIAALLVIFGISSLKSGSILPGYAENSTLATRREEMEHVFEHASRGYSTYCIGHDTLHPVTNTYEDHFGG